MSYVNVEAAVELMLKTQWVSDLEDAGITCAVRGHWLDDNPTGSSEDIIFAQVNLSARPNQPRGWQQPLRYVVVDINMVTFQPDDKKGNTLTSIYDVIRESIDEDTWSSPSLTEVNAIMVLEGGFRGAGEINQGELLNVVNFPIQVEVCLGAQ